MSEFRDNTPVSDDLQSWIEDAIRWIPHELFLPRQTYRACMTLPQINTSFRTNVSLPRNYEGHLAARLRETELHNTLNILRNKGVVKEEEVDEILRQHEVLEQRRIELLQHIGEVVVVCNGEFFFGKSLDEAVKKAKDKCGDKPYYSETIGVVNFPSLL